MRQNRIMGFWLSSMLLGLIGCSTVKDNPASKLEKKAEQIAWQNDFEKKWIKTAHFTLTSFQKIQKPGAPTTIYIEGDGATWITRTKLSPNPTPRNPLALKLAVLDKSANVVYLARPCQYSPFSLNPCCQPDIWSNLRFSQLVLNTMNEAVEKIKSETQSIKIHLVGFSGGAAIAVLLAAKRQDIASLKTIAGDLNPVALSHYHQTTPLREALNPFEVARKLITLPQQHFVGDEDKIIPVFIVQSFVAEQKKSGGNCASYKILPGITHHQGWEKHWPSLLMEPMPCL